MKKIKFIRLIIGLAVFSLVLLLPTICKAMPPGTLLYRTSNNGKMYGYSSDPLIYAEKGILKDVNSGHAGIYIGQENGEDYIVEAMSNGVVKTPAKYFVNTANGEVFLGAKIPSAANALQTAKVVALAKSLVGKKLAYDLDFKHQKGPESGEWTCVGLTEKLYESANISNPNNLAALEYDPNYYAVDITPDGFDNYSLVNSNGDCFSSDREFSKIARRPNLLLPAPELIGYDLGLEYNGERYIFLPYTQFLQKTLKSVEADIPISSFFEDKDARSSLNTKALVLRWSLINNPLSTIKNLAQRTKTVITETALKTQELAKKIATKIFGENTLAEITLDNSAITKKTVPISGKTSKTVATAGNSTAPAYPAVKVNKASGNSNSNSSSNSGSNKTVTSKIASGSSSKNSSNDKKVSVAEKPGTIKTKTEINKSSSTVVSKNNLTASSSSPINNYYAPSVSSSPVSSGGGGGGGSSQSAIKTEDWPKLAKINKVYATGDNDFIELINTTDHDFDLAAASYRLEKAKTTEGAGIMMRFGNPADGAYPGGTIIKAHDKYLIVRDDASSYFKNQADAIATRDEFNWPGSGWTFYLGVGAISSSQDKDIVDALGFGSDATYFQGTGPALEIEDNYVLERIASQGNNFTDFDLILTDDPDVLEILAAQAAELASSTDDIATSTETVATSTDDVATSTDEIATSTDGIATSSDEIATSTDEIASSTETAATSTGGVATSMDDTTTSNEGISTSSPVIETPLALINKIYSTGDNNWVELFNPNDFDFDLAVAAYRLEKTKTALTPSLMMRIGDPLDGFYPGGTIIKAHDNYLIVRDDANVYFKDTADAIAIRDEFTWSNSDYTFYLGDGPISSNTDLNIKDMVGFGLNSVYWQGSGPAPSILDNYFLNRLTDYKDNATDFNLIMSDDPFIIPEINSDPNLDLFVPPAPLISPGLTNVWHFDECFGTGHWAVGKWDCAQELSYNYDNFYAPLDPPVNLNSFSASFYYKKSSQFPRLDLQLTNPDVPTDHLLLIVEPGMITVEGLPNSLWRYFSPEIIFDESWHQATLVVNQAGDYWSVYIDGQEIIRENFFANLPIFTQLEMFDTNGPAIFDELSIWNRPLEPVEILDNYLSDAPYSPIAIRDPQLAAELIHSWKFEENAGLTALDSLSPTVLNVDLNSWTGRLHNNYSLGLSNGNNYSLNFNDPLISQDLSLTFWWRNRSYPDGGRTNIFLEGGSNNTNILALLADDYRLGFWFNGQYGILAEGLNTAIPYDDAWHHLALVYDSYRYKLNFYVDGINKASSSLIRLADGEAITGLKITDDNFNTEIDDLNIYAGALSQAQVNRLYLDTK